MTRLHTVGHGTLTAEAFTSLLDGAHVGRVADVRSFPAAQASESDDQMSLYKYRLLCKWLLYK